MKHDVTLAQLRPLTDFPDESLARLGRVEIPEHERGDLYAIADRVTNMDARGLVTLDVGGPEPGQCLFVHDWTGDDAHLIGFLGADGVLYRDDARCPPMVPVVFVFGRDQQIRDAYAADDDLLRAFDEVMEGWA